MGMGGGFAPMSPRITSPARDGPGDILSDFSFLRGEDPLR